MLIERLLLPERLRTCGVSPASKPLPFLVRADVSAQACTGRECFVAAFAGAGVVALVAVCALHVVAQVGRAEEAFAAAGVRALVRSFFGVRANVFCQAARSCECFVTAVVGAAVGFGSRCGRAGAM